MYKLYKTRDLSLLMEKNLFPFLTRKICNYDSGWSDINSLRCVDKGLNRLIKDPITKCKKIKIANKRVCSVHEEWLLVPCGKTTIVRPGTCRLNNSHKTSPSCGTGKAAQS